MEGGNDDSLKRSHDSLSPQTPVELRKKMRRHARTVYEEEGDADDVMPARLAVKRKVEKHPSKAALAKVAKRIESDDDDDDVPSIPAATNLRRVSDVFQTPPKPPTSRSVFEDATAASVEHDKRAPSGDAGPVLPPPARVLTEEEMERRRRRRNSKTFQSRRKSLTPNAKTKQYVSEMYSTIIKMSSENKINSKNSWSLHLIDHIDDILSGKRHEDEPTDGAAAGDTYNFQKASCTLDASVKIYSYRVDDTWNSSFKVLENLTRGDESNQHDGGDDDDVTERRATSKKLTVANTIETNLKNINMKSVDLEFQVDPLFQKMSQAFDEGGAKGMLMVNLSVHNGCKIVLDSSNIKAANDSSSQQLVPVEDDDPKPRKMINISGLTKRLRASATAVESFDICPKLEHFYDQLKTMNNEYFDKKISVPRLDVTASSHSRRLTLLSQGLITPRKTPRKALEEAPTSDMRDPSVEDAHDVTQGDDHGMDEPDFGMGGDHDMGDDDPDAGQDEPSAPTGQDEAVKAEVETVTKAEADEQPVIAKPLNFDDEEDQTTYLLESALMRSVNAEQMDDYSFFDAKTLKNWAGPQHWKVKLPGIRIKKSAVRVPDGPAKAATDNDDEPAKGKRKQRNATPGKLNFTLTPAQVTLALKKPKQKSSLEISAPILKRNESKAAELVHPVDMHIKIERFYQLFTRPRSNVMFASMMAPAKANHTTPFNQPPSAFGHARYDDNDDDGVDFGGNDYLNDEDDFQVSGLVQADRIVDKVDIQYERFAKRVDVKKLKESIWDSLPFQQAEEDPSIQELTTATADLQLNPANDHAVSFEALVHDVAPKVPSNVTVSFYFICMLHLANDKGLELVGQDDMRDFTILHDATIPR